MAPEIYKKYVVIEKGVPVLYVQLMNALYGTLKAALLFYKKLVNDLKSIGFIINPYDFCVANKFINGKQMTIIWHVDDLKISHVDGNEITKIIEWLKSKYEDKNIGMTAMTSYALNDVFDYRIRNISNIVDILITNCSLIINRVD